MNEYDILKIIKTILDIDQKHTGIEYLQNLLKNIAINLDVKYALIGHPSDNFLTSIQTDVIYSKGSFLNNITYNLKNTPCELVLSGERICIHEKNVCIDFPEDKLLQEMGIESYIGAPVTFKNSSGVSSILILLDDKPMKNRDFFISIVDFLALRVSAEIEKYNIEENLIKQVTQQTFELNNVKDLLAKKLEETETMARNFFDLSINMLLVADYNGQILNINSGCERILGYKPEELINTSCIDLIHPDDIQRTINELGKLEKGNLTFYFENRYRHKNGSYKTLAWTSNPHVENNIIYASAQDITDTKNKDKIIHQQSKMASMGEMIENIAHQWRQPLSIISTASTSIKLKNELKLLEEDEINDHMTHINDSVQYLSRTIDDFRDFFRDNRTETEFKINDTFEKTFKLVSSQFKTDTITLIKNIDETSLFGFENELIQVLINILNNARYELIKKQPKEKLLFINTIVKKDILEITIQDNAGGIPKDFIYEIFDPNFTTKNEDEGTGIGLYMSKMIIHEHMDGTLEARNVNVTHDNKTYVGAEFKISLPLHN